MPNILSIQLETITDTNPFDYKINSIIEINMQMGYFELHISSANNKTIMY